jgi:hypothetical protein
MAAIVHVHSGMGARLATLRNATVLERSWVRNDAGSARFTLPQSDDQANDGLIGPGYIYVLESDVGLPAWVGYLAGRWSENGQMLTVQLRELTYVLASRFTGANDNYTAGAGAILRAVLAKAQTALSHPFDLGDFTDAGPYQAKNFRHSSVLDGVAKPLATDTGYWFWADYRVSPGGISGAISWASRRDVDRSARVLLEEGRNLADEPAPVLEDHSGQPLERVTVVGSTSGGTAYAARPMSTVSAGIRASLLASEGVSIDEQATDDRSTLEAAQAAVAKTLGRTLRLVVVDTALWSECALGADVRVRLPRYNLGRGLDITARIVGVQPDEDTQKLALTVEV